MPSANKSTPDPRVTKRKVTMRSVVADPSWNPDENDGVVKTITAEVVDYVRPDFLDAYVADARTRWQVVTVSDAPDAGPGGYDGPTTVPPNLAHPLAGSYFPATGDDNPVEHAPPGLQVITNTVTPEG